MVKNTVVNVTLSYYRNIGFLNITYINLALLIVIVHVMLSLLCHIRPPSIFYTVDRLGVAIPWRTSLSKYISITEKDENFRRFISISINNFFNECLVVSCAYFPYFSNISDYLFEAGAVICYIDNTLTLNSNTWHIVGGDFNFECDSANSNFGFIFVCGDGVGLQTNMVRQICIGRYFYTYMHETFCQFSWLDHFFISKNFQQLIWKSENFDCDKNISDHLPIAYILVLPNMVTQVVSSKHAAFMHKTCY